MLAEEYYDNFTQLVSDLSADLGVSDLPTFIPNYATDEELFARFLSIRRCASKLITQIRQRSCLRILSALVGLVSLMLRLQLLTVKAR